MRSYWDRLLERRITRRKALTGGSALVAGALLAACGVETPPRSSRHKPLRRGGVPISIAQPDLVEETKQFQDQFLSSLAAFSFAWYRDGIRHASTAEANADLRRRIQDQGRRQLVILSTDASDYPNGLSDRNYTDDPTFEAFCGFEGAFPWSSLDLDRMESRIRTHCEAFKAAGVQPEWWEIFNEGDYVCFNGDLPWNGGGASVLDKDLQSHADTYNAIFVRARSTVLEYFPYARFMTYGIANFSDHDNDLTFPAIQNPGKIIARMANRDLIDAYAVHVYPASIQDSPTLVWDRMQKFAADTGDATRPIWVTECGFPNASYTEAELTHNLMWLHRALVTTPGLRVDNIFHYALADFSNKYLVDERTWEPLEHAGVFLDDGAGPPSPPAASALTAE